MRNSLQLDKTLLAEAEEVAMQTGRTVTAVVEDALRTMIEHSKKVIPSTPIVLPTFRGEGLYEGVDLTNSADLRDHMDTSYP